MGYTAAVFQMVCYIFQAIKAAEEHLLAVTKERSYYRSACKQGRSDLEALFSSNGSFQPPPPASALRPLCNDITVHFSFDMAQQAS